MLSRVADSLYWMSRYFERVDHCARVLEANHTLMLTPSEVALEDRWRRISRSLGFPTQLPMASMVSDPEERSSMLACLTSARENASQVREQITSEMWEGLNRLYHRVMQAQQSLDGDADLLRLLSVIREDAFRFYGVTDHTMNHDEGWRFIQLGKFMERACSVSALLDAHFSDASRAQAVDCTGLLTSCSAFEAYCKVYTADFTPERVAEFLLLHPEFPYSVRYAAEQMNEALESIAQTSEVRKTARIDRTIGQLRSSLAYAQIDEIMSRDFRAYLNGVVQQCANLHSAVYEIYIDYPIESVFEV